MPFEPTQKPGHPGDPRPPMPSIPPRKAPEGAKPAKPKLGLYRVWIHFNGIISITNGPGPGLAHAWPITGCAATEAQIEAALNELSPAHALYHENNWLVVDLVLGRGNASDFDRFRDFEIFGRRLWSTLSRVLAGNHDD